MTEISPAVLIHCNIKDAEYSKIVVSENEFVIGRAKTVSFIIRSLLVSKSQCVFQKKGQDWTICDKSSFGTFVNGSKLEKDIPTVIYDGNHVEFGPTGRFKFTFHTKDIPSSSLVLPPTKKRRTGENDGDSERTQPYYEDEKHEIEFKYKKHVEELQERHSQEMKSLQARLQSDNAEQEIMNKEKQELEEQQARERKASEEKLLEEKKILEDKIKEMQNLLEEKDEAQKLLNQKLQEKEEEHIRDLKQLEEQKDAQVKAMLEDLKKEVAEREETVRIQLEKEIQNLQDEKVKLENNIRGELSKKEGESAENLKHLQEELKKVKKDLFNVEGKKQYLEKELEETTKAKEDASESCLKAKQDVLQNFGELMETELQCSICNELFVTATTLNCTHTFCKSCILEWKKKKKECPVCRAKITSENRSIALDNFIDRMISNLSEELKNRRQEIVEERQVQELLGPKQKPDSTSGSRSRGRRRRANANTISSSSNSDTISQSNNNDIIVISSDSSESDSSSSSSSNLSYDDELGEEDDEDFMEGDPRAFYGGYGYCYRCGRRGHWARGCPDY